MTTRREFIQKVSAGTAALVGAGKVASSPAAPVERPGLPRIRIGPHSISRLICGANPFNGGSHLSTFVNREMKSYYTPDQILKTLKRCEEVGINCWQASVRNMDLYRQLRDRGLRMQYICIEADPSRIPALARGGAIGVAHHGEVTDRLFKSGKIDEVHDFLKRVKDGGLQAGVSTHMPAVVDTIESRGWDVDYYMTCVYERHRSKEDLERLLGQAPIPVGEVYLPLDPPRMFQAIQKTPRPCLAFKILAAGRLSNRKAWVEQAFRQTFESIKPGDGIIVGIYDRYSDQVAENAGYARRFGST